MGGATATVNPEPWIETHPPGTAAAYLTVTNITKASFQEKCHKTKDIFPAIPEHQIAITKNFLDGIIISSPPPCLFQINRYKTLEKSKH